MSAFDTTDKKKQPDGALVAAAKRGDTHAFEELVLRHRRKVVAMAERIINNREDAEDVAQESFQEGLPASRLLSAEVSLFYLADPHRHERSFHVASSQARSLGSLAREH